MSLFSKAKSKLDSSSYEIKRNEIELVYNHYLQNGNNSAVTGGVGTEELTVFGPSLKYKSSKGRSSLSIQVGSDIISSASTDKIDSIVSSASIKDARSYLTTSLSRKFKDGSSVGSLGFSSSVESDYFSLGTTIGVKKNDESRSRSYGVLLQALHDDLRWGRIKNGVLKPVKLIYPQELRYKDWFKERKRTSINVHLHYIQALNKRNKLGLFGMLSYQFGLLSTPFHRVYFSDNSLAVEKLPAKRIRGSLKAQINSFVGGKTVIKNTVGVYQDDFGIIGANYKAHIALKLKPRLTLIGSARLYTQSKSKFFEGYASHVASSEFYTSDYDLSNFSSIQISWGAKYKPRVNLFKSMIFETINLRYTYLKRSNGLYAHLFSWSSPISQTTRKYRKKRNDDVLKQ